MIEMALIFLMALPSYGFELQEGGLHEVQSVDINPFVSDGCTLFPEGTQQHPTLWQHCCLQHDLYYWAGGTREFRKLADRNLRQCFVNKGLPVLGELVFLAVQAGALSPIKVKEQKFGNAWGKKFSARMLAEEEVAGLLRDPSIQNIDGDLIEGFSQDLRRENQKQKK